MVEEAVCFLEKDSCEGTGWRSTRPSTACPPRPWSAELPSRSEGRWSCWASVGEAAAVCVQSGRAVKTMEGAPDMFVGARARVCVCVCGYVQNEN